MDDVVILGSVWLHHGCKLEIHETQMEAWNMGAFYMWNSDALDKHYLWNRGYLANAVECLNFNSWHSWNINFSSNAFSLCKWVDNQSNL